MTSPKIPLLAALLIAAHAFAVDEEEPPPIEIIDPSGWYPSSGAATRSHAEAALKPKSRPAPHAADVQDWYSGRAPDAEALERAREELAETPAEVGEWYAAPKPKAEVVKPLPRAKLDFPGRGPQSQAKGSELGAWYGGAPVATEARPAESPAWDAWGLVAPAPAKAVRTGEGFVAAKSAPAKTVKSKPGPKPEPSAAAEADSDPEIEVGEWLGRAPVRKRKAAVPERPDLASWFDGSAAKAAKRLDKAKAEAQKAALGPVTQAEVTAWFPKAGKASGPHFSAAVSAAQAGRRAGHDAPQAEGHATREPQAGHDDHAAKDAHGGHDAHAAKDAHDGHDAHAAKGAHDEHDAHAAKEAHGGHDAHAAKDAHGGHDAHGAKDSHGDHGEGETPYMAPRPDTAFARALDWEQGTAEVLEYAVKRGGGAGDIPYRGRLVTERIFLKPDGTVGRKAAGKQDVDALNATLALSGEEDGRPFSMETVAKLPRREAFRLLRQDQSLQGGPGNAHRSLDCIATPPRLRMASSGGEPPRDTVLTRWPVYTEEMLFTYLRAVPQRAGYREEVWIQDWGPIGGLMVKPQYAAITVRSKVRIRDLETWYVTVDRNDGRRSEFWVSSQGLHPVTLASLADKTEWSLKNISRRKAPSW